MGNGLKSRFVVNEWMMLPNKVSQPTGKWRNKGGGSEDEGELEKCWELFKEILDDPQPDAIDFLDTIKLNLFASEIFVFTPKGELKTMPQNSTALDFAFSLHTDIGSHYWRQSQS